MVRRLKQRHIKRIILCRECWQWNRISTHNGRCMKLILLTEPDHYCGYATTSQARNPKT